MSLDTGQVISLVIAVLGTGGIATLYSIWRQRQKAPLEDESVAVTTTIAANADLRDTLAELRTALSHVREDVKSQAIRIKSMQVEINDLQRVQAEDRAYIRAAVPVIAQYVPDRYQPLPPEWYRL